MPASFAWRPRVMDTQLRTTSILSRSDYRAALWGELALVCIFVAVLVSTLECNMHRQAILDPLTGPLNRAGLELMVESRSGERLEGLPRPVVVVDLDGFEEAAQLADARMFEHKRR